jgi:molybdopterin-guanine dinucleotide biosynthesis protein A
MTVNIHCGGVILCGGQSRRMGFSKATLPFGGESMLLRVVRLLRAEVEPLVVVAAADQELPDLPQGIALVRDERPEQGPLEGLRVGLSALAGKADAAYVTSCDVPLLVGAVVRRMIELLGEHLIAVPVEGEFHHPLAAVYRVEVAAHVARLLSAGKRRPVFLFDEVPTRRVGVELLRDVDPQLTTLRNLNHPRDYFAALEEAGLPVPAEVRAKLEAASGGE